MNICVYGAASDDIAAVYKRAGEELGEQMAKRGHGLIFGGGASGMMGAVARGVTRGGGHLVSIAPSFFDVDGILYPECDEYIFTNTMRERKQKMEDLSEAFVISPGGIGTFDEFFEIFTLRQLQRHTKPIAILNTEGYYDHLLEMLRHTAEQNFMDGRNFELFKVTDDISELLDYLENPPQVHLDVRKLRRIDPDNAQS